MREDVSGSFGLRGGRAKSLVLVESRTVFQVALAVFSFHLGTCNLTNPWHACS